MKTATTPQEREKERVRQLRKYHANKERYAFRDVAAGFKHFWAKRGILR